jgi:hypothetical protein
MAEVQADGNVRFVNPLSEGGDGDLDPTADASETPPPGSVDARTADFKHELTDDELGDLTFAFQALDSDSSGTIEPLELHAMVSVLAGPGTVVALDSVKELFKETKDEFRAWMKQQHEDATLPPWMDPDEAARQGVHGETHTGVERHHAELNIEKGNKDHAVWGRVKRFGQHPLIKPLSSGIDATNRILQMSYGLAKDVTTDLFFDEDSEAVGEQSAAAKELKNLIFSPDHLVFAEYVHMMCSHALLERFVTDKDWHKRSSHMRKFRQAFGECTPSTAPSACARAHPRCASEAGRLIPPRSYVREYIYSHCGGGADTADVNGDNNLEFDELEMVMTALDHEHDLSHEDMLYLWDIMIQGEPELKKSSTSMNFTQYLHGLSNAQEDEKANAWLNFEARNKFELLSLLIDTPVSHAEEEKLLADLTGLEKMGIAMLKKDREELEKEHTKAVLKRAGNGTLRKLTPEQVKNMNSLKIQLTALSGFIGFLWTIGPCLVENHVCAKYGVNGIKNTYFTCDQLSYLDVQDINGTVGYRMNATHSLEDLVLKTCQITQNLGHWTGDTYLGEVWPTRYVEGPESQCMPGASWDPDASIAERCMSCECMSCGCIPHDDGEIAFDAEHPLVMWWLWVGIAIGINVVFEIGMLMFYAVRYCVRVSRALDQRLVPLNADRAFVADSLVRAAFELGNPVSPVMGVDPGAEPKSKFKILLLVVAYKAKVVLTGQVIKFVIGKLTPPYFSLWAKPWCGACAIRVPSRATACNVCAASLQYAVPAARRHNGCNDPLGRSCCILHHVASTDPRIWRLHQLRSFQRYLGAPL